MAPVVFQCKEERQSNKTHVAKRLEFELINILILNKTIIIIIIIIIIISSSSSSSSSIVVYVSSAIFQTDH